MDAPFEVKSSTCMAGSDRAPGRFHKRPSTSSVRSVNVNHRAWTATGIRPKKEVTPFELTPVQELSNSNDGIIIDFSLSFREDQPVLHSPVVSVIHNDLDLDRACLSDLDNSDSISQNSFNITLNNEFFNKVPDEQTNEGSIKTHNCSYLDSNFSNYSDLFCDCALNANHNPCFTATSDACKQKAFYLSNSGAHCHTCCLESKKIQTLSVKNDYALVDDKNVLCSENELIVDKELDFYLEKLLLKNLNIYQKSFVPETIEEKKLREAVEGNMAAILAQKNDLQDSNETVKEKLCKTVDTQLTKTDKRDRPYNLQEDSIKASIEEFVHQLSQEVAECLTKENKDILMNNENIINKDERALSSARCKSIAAITAEESAKQKKVAVENGKASLKVHSDNSEILKKKCDFSQSERRNLKSADQSAESNNNFVVKAANSLTQKIAHSQAKDKVRQAQSVSTQEDCKVTRESDFRVSAPVKNSEVNKNAIHNYKKTKKNGAFTVKLKNNESHYDSLKEPKNKQPQRSRLGISDNRQETTKQHKLQHKTKARFRAKNKMSYLTQMPSNSSLSTVDVTARRAPESYNKVRPERSQGKGISIFKWLKNMGSSASDSHLRNVREFKNVAQPLEKSDANDALDKIYIQDPTDESRLLVAEEIGYILGEPLQKQKKETVKESRSIQTSAELKLPTIGGGTIRKQQPRKSLFKRKSASAPRKVKTPKKAIANGKAVSLPAKNGGYIIYPSIKAKTGINSETRSVHFLEAEKNGKTNDLSTVSSNVANSSSYPAYRQDIPYHAKSRELPKTVFVPSPVTYGEDYSNQQASRQLPVSSRVKRNQITQELFSRFYKNRERRKNAENSNKYSENENVGEMNLSNGFQKTNNSLEFDRNVVKGDHQIIQMDNSEESFKPPVMSSSENDPGNKKSPSPPPNQNAGKDSESTVPIVMLQGFFKGKGIRTPHHRKPSLVVKDISLPPHLMDVTSLLRGALPILPRPLAALCLLFNILIPGLGTMLSGCFGICWGRNRLAPVEDKHKRMLSVLVTSVTGLVQLFTVTFFLVGWFWGIAWGILLVSISNKYVKFLSENRSSITGAVGLEMLAVNAT